MDLLWINNMVKRLHDQKCHKKDRRNILLLHFPGRELQRYQLLPRIFRDCLLATLQKEVKHFFVEPTDPFVPAASLKRPCKLTAIHLKASSSDSLISLPFIGSSLALPLGGHRRAPGKCRDLSSHQHILFMPHRYSKKTLKTI